MAETNRPDFIYSGGNVIEHSPLRLDNANMYGFFVKGNLNNLQQTIDTCLNQPASTKYPYRFKALSPYVMVTFTEIEKAYSLVPIDRNKGYISEIDIITWIIVGEMEDHNGEEKLHHLYWFPHHIWVNNSLALINGRELYGYTKYICEYHIPGLDEEPDYFSCSAEGFQPFSRETELQLHPLMEVKKVADGEDTVLEEWTDVFTEVGKLLLAQDGLFDLDKDAVEQLLSLILKPEIDQIFLKQFPDSSGTKAVYQAIVAAPAQVKKLHHVKLLGNEYQFHLHPLDTFPLAETLGFTVGAQDAILPFNAYFDFQVPQGRELVDNSRIEPEKIAILGGGVGALTTAFYLTDQPGWQNKYDITVYQTGWRLGGKGASGRNPAYGDRIEEHGLHIWFGFYDNAFKTIQKAYDLLDRPDGAPLQKWDDAFKPHSFVVVQEWIGNEWKTWPMEYATNDLKPGTGDEEIDLWDLVRTVYTWLKKWIMDLDEHEKQQQQQARTLHDLDEDDDQNWFERLAESVEATLDDFVDDFKSGIASALNHIENFIESLPKLIRNHDSVQNETMKFALTRLKKWLYNRFEDVLEDNDDIRRLFISVDLGLTALIGMIEDGVFEHGFDVINKYDFTEWLRKHGANEKWTIDCALVRGFYDLVFGYENGDFNKPNVEAGTIIRAMARIALLYKGAIMYKMQAGMGDVVFTPFYQVLQDRGVKFEYFHRVEELIPQGNAIDEIVMTQQVALQDGMTDYDPLVDVKGLPCWPSQPNYDQLDPEQAQLLQQHNINLESFWTNWSAVYEQHFGRPLPVKTLKKGRDFDKVVFGIAIGALPHLCPKLLEQDAKLKAMSDHVKTVTTQAYQVWTDKTLSELGWNPIPDSGEEPVLSAFVKPFDTWASMGQLLTQETWPTALEPKSVAYFCSAQTIESYPPPSDHEFPARSYEQAKLNAKNNLRHSIHHLWRHVAEPGAFDWNILIDPNQEQGEARFDSQFWRSNIDPSDRYVQSVKDSTRYRLNTDGTRFANLYLTGDWINTGLDVGCVEAATMAGMQTSRAISGHPEKIEGEVDF